MDKTALAQLFYKEQQKINDNDTFTSKEKVNSIYKLFIRLFDFLIQKEQLKFTTLFAKIAYISHKYYLNPQLQYYIHQFRKQNASIKYLKNGSSNSY